MGLIRFNRALKVTTKQLGVDDALGETSVWYYTSETLQGAPVITSYSIHYTKLYDACLNLVTNAVRYSPDGGPIRISWTAIPSGARFAVEDRGMGIV